MRGNLWIVEKWVKLINLKRKKQNSKFQQRVSLSLIIKDFFCVLDSLFKLIIYKVIVFALRI